MKSRNPRNKTLKNTLTTRNLYIPKKPTFSIILANIQLTSVLASTCTSGNHEWSGHNGYFTAKVTNKNNHKNSHRYTLSYPKSVHTSNTKMFK